MFHFGEYIALRARKDYLSRIWFLLNHRLYMWKWAPLVLAWYTVYHIPHAVLVPTKKPCKNSQCCQGRSVQKRKFLNFAQILLSTLICTGQYLKRMLFPKSDVNRQRRNNYDTIELTNDKFLKKNLRRSERSRDTANMLTDVAHSHFVYSLFKYKTIKYKSNIKKLDTFPFLIFLKHFLSKVSIWKRNTVLRKIIWLLLYHFCCSLRRTMGSEICKGKVAGLSKLLALFVTYQK